jgi:hypothetical protein
LEKLGSNILRLFFDDIDINPCSIFWVYNNPKNRLMNLPKQIEICFLPTLLAGRSHLYEHTLDGDYMGKGGEGGDYLSTSNNQVSESWNLKT